MIGEHERLNIFFSSFLHKRSQLVCKIDSNTTTQNLELEIFCVFPDVCRRYLPYTLAHSLARFSVFLFVLGGKGKRGERDQHTVLAYITLNLKNSKKRKHVQNCYGLKVYKFHIIAKSLYTRFWIFSSSHQQVDVGVAINWMKLEQIF